VTHSVPDLSKVELVTVGVETKLGAHYSFPDMEKSALEHVLPHLSDRVPEGQECLMLVNASFCTMSVLYRIIRKVTVNGEDWWVCPNSGV
jgi:hypothetical protein